MPFFPGGPHITALIKSMWSAKAYGTIFYGLAADLAYGF